MSTLSKTNLLIETDNTASETAPDIAPDYTLTLPKAVYQLHRFVSRDEQRSNLSHVRITQCGPQAARQYLATATDGHRLVTVEFRAAETDDCGPLSGDVLLPGPLLNATRPKGKQTSGVLTGIGDIHTLTTGELSATFENAHDWTFPDTQRVIPAKGAPDGVACRVAAFNLRYLSDLAAMCKACGERDIGPQISWPTDPLSPLRADVTLDGCEVVYVQMPMRV